MIVEIKGAKIINNEIYAGIGLGLAGNNASTWFVCLSVCKLTEDVFE
jgi:hypothetical protein